MHSLLPHLQNRTTEMLDFLAMLVHHESPSHSKVANDALADVLAWQFKQLTGGSAELVPNQEVGHHVRCEWNPSGPDAPQILLLGHFDTVWPLGTLETMPFRLEGDQAFGSGIFDMKAGLVQGLFALATLRELNRNLGAKIVFLMTSDEEIGSPTSRALIEAEAAKSRCVLVLEPAADGALKTSRKGLGHFHLTVEGQSAHSGLEPEKGRSAIVELAHQIVYLHSLNDFEGGTTLNVGVIEGGTAANVVAAHASAHFDLRVPSQQAAEAILAKIHALQPITPDTRLHLRGDIGRPPLERTPGTTHLFNLAQQIARDELDFDLTEAAVGGASDGNFTGRLAPTLDGLGPVGDGAHAAHEHILWPEMPRRAALLARLIEVISRQEIPR